MGLSGLTVNSLVLMSKEELMEKLRARMDSGFLSRLSEGRIGRLIEQLRRYK